MNSDIIDKLKKILARTEGNGATEAEMNTAMAMAQKLAVAHNIDLASIKVDEGDEDPAIETDRADLRSNLYRKVKAHHNPIAVLLMECFQVKFIYLDHRGGAAVVGERVDVQLATYCYHWLDGLFPELYSKYVKKLGLPATPVDRVRRRSFFEGLSAGIRANNRRAVQALSASDANKYALVLVDKEKVVEARYKDEFPHARAAVQRARRFNEGAFLGGRAEGSKIKLNAGLAAPKAQLT